MSQVLRNNVLVSGGGGRGRGRPIGSINFGEKFRRRHGLLGPVRLAGRGHWSILVYREATAHLDGRSESTADNN